MRRSDRGVYNYPMPSTIVRVFVGSTRGDLDDDCRKYARDAIGFAGGAPRQGCQSRRSRPGMETFAGEGRISSAFVAGSDQADCTQIVTGFRESPWFGADALAN